MKKIVSLLLIGCMVLGLVACGNANEESKSSESSETSTSVVESSVSSTVASSEEVVNTKPYEGTEIEVWGYAADKLEDVSKVSVGYDYIIACAMEEWCQENGVTLKFAGAYNQNSLLAAVASGATPDLVCHYNIFPLVANLGITMPWTDDCYEELAEITGTYDYVDAWSTKGESHGILYPIQGRVVLNYNRTIFEQYGAKTPKEYWMEGNWTWDTFAECLKSVTKDTDGDGVNDTYGMSTYFFTNPVDMWLEGSDGKLVSQVDTPAFRKYVEVLYNGVVDGSVVDCTDQLAKKFDSPRPVCEFNNAAVYEINNLFYQYKDETYRESVPIPGLTNDDATYRLGNMGMAKCAATDNEEAVEAMVCHVFKVVMKAISLTSQGLIPCDYEFVQGTTPCSAKLLELWEPYMEKVRAGKEYPHYDEEYFLKFNEFVNTNSPSGKKTSYAGVSVKAAELIEQPPATSIATLKETLQTKLDTYNSLYVY